MKSCLFALTISLLAIGCSSNQGSTNETVPQAPVMQSLVIDTPPPHPEVDPDYQEDQSGTKPSDTIVGNTGYTRRQLDSITKHKWGPVEHEPGKGVAKPHDPPKPR